MFFFFIKVHFAERRENAIEYIESDRTVSHSSLNVVCTCV